MSINLVMKSLERFFDEQLNSITTLPEDLVFITRDSNRADIYNEGLTAGELITAGTVTFILNDEDGDPYQSEDDLVGWTLSFASYTRRIIAWDSGTSTVTIDLGFSGNIPSGSALTLSHDKWIYIKMPYVVDGKGNNCNREQVPRVYMYVKTKDDSKKEKLYNVIENINNAIKSNCNNFNIYDDDEITVLGDGRFHSRINSNEVVEDTNDLQTHIVDYQLSYYVKFI